jgi:hypothetical protein
MKPVVYPSEENTSAPDGLAKQHPFYKKCLLRLVTARWRMMKVLLKNIDEDLSYISRKKSVAVMKVRAHDVRDIVKHYVKCKSLQ